MRISFGVAIMCFFSLYSQAHYVSAKTLTGTGAGKAESAARMQSLQAIAQQLNADDFNQSKTLLLMSDSTIPNDFTKLVTLSVLEPLFGVKYNVTMKSNGFEVQAKYNIDAHITALMQQTRQDKKTVESLENSISSLALPALNDLLSSDRDLQQAKALLTALYSAPGQLAEMPLSTDGLTASQRNLAIARLDSLSKLQASSRAPNAQEAAKEIYAALAEQISIKVETGSVTTSGLNEQGASQTFQQLTQTSTNINLSGVQITANKDPQKNATYIGTLYPRRSAAQQEQMLQEAESQMLLALKQGISADLNQTTINSAKIDATLAYLVGFDRYTQARQKYNTLIALSGGWGITVSAVVSPIYANVLQNQVSNYSAKPLTLVQVGKIIGFFNGAQQAISLCPLIPSAQSTVVSTIKLEQGLNSLTTTQQSAAQLLRLSIQQDNKVLAEIVNPQGKMIYTNSFKLDQRELKTANANPAATAIIITDTSNETSLSADTLYDLMQQQIDVGDAIIIRSGCLPTLSNKQNFLTVANVASHVIELDINYNFDSFFLKPSPIEHKFCRVRINGKHHNLSSNKTTSLFAEGKQSPYVDEESAITQASTKALKKLEKRLSRLLQ
jgi:hypothetical protein